MSFWQRNVENQDKKIFGKMWEEQSQSCEGQVLYKMIEEGSVGNGWSEKMYTYPEGNGVG